MNIRQFISGTLTKYERPGREPQGHTTSRNSGLRLKPTFSRPRTWQISDAALEGLQEPTADLPDFVAALYAALRDFQRLGRSP